MPPQRPANHGLGDVAAQLRRYHIWPTYDLEPAVAAVKESNGSSSGGGEIQRRPSNRPLDHRWDRSRGILFSGPQRTAPSNTAALNQRRTYASKPIRPPTHAGAAANTTVKKATSARSIIDSGWKSAGFAPTPSGMSSKERQELEKKVRDLSNDLKVVTAREQERRAKMEVQAKQLASLREQLAKDEATLATVKANAARELAEEKRLNRPRVIENNAVLADVRLQAEAPLLAEINRYKGVEKSYQDKVEALQTALEEQRQRHDTAFRNAVRTAADQSRDVVAALDRANKEIEGIRSRKQNDREDYTRYHDIFAELNRCISDARREVKLARNRIIDERALWRKSARIFKASDNLRLFLHSSKYKGVKDAIEGYLEEQASSATTAIDGLENLMTQLNQEHKDFQPDAHDSRSLTRHHQLDNHQNAYDRVHLAEYFSSLGPFHALRKSYDNELAQLEMEFSELSSNASVPVELQRGLRALKDNRRKVDQICNFFGHVQEWRALRALQEDDIVEQAVWVRTVKAKQNLQDVVDRFHGGVHAYPEVKKQAEWISCRDDVRAQRVAFDGLVAHVRQRYLLAHDLGKMQGEQDVVKKTINQRIAKAKAAVVSSLSELGFQISHRTRRDLDNAFGTYSTKKRSKRSQPNDSSSTLKLSLVKRINKLPVAVSTEKKSIAPKPISRRRAAKLKKALSRRRSVTLRSHLKTRPASGGVASGEAEVNNTATGTGISGMKPTEARQAQYRRPSYDIEAGAGKRTSRGENMGFNTLKNALTRARPSEEHPDNSASIAFTSDASQSHGKGTGRSADRGPSRLETEIISFQSSTQTPDQQPTSDEDVASAFEMSLSDKSSGLEVSSSEEVKEATTPEESPEESPEEPQTVLTYQIPPKDYREAVLASQTSSAAFWSHTLYKNAENKKPTVYYCQSYDQTEAKAQLFLNEPVIGFDLEWEFNASLKGDKPDIKRNVSLIQIACEDKIALFQIARFRTAKTAEEHMPPSLRKVLESEDIVKAGVNVSGDARRMKVCLGVDMKGVFELSHMFRIVKQSKKYRANFSLVGLAEQVHEVLLLPLKKDDTRTSAWSKELNNQQTSYAAADAYAGFQLFHRLDNARKVMKPTPPRPAFFETFKPLILGNGDLVYRSTDPNAPKRKVVAKTGDVVEVEGEEDEEGEEFFDALEGVDSYELGDDSALPAVSAEEEISGSLAEEEISGPISHASASSYALPRSTASGSASSAGSGSAAKQEIAYPELPSQTPATKSVAGSKSTTPAPSRTPASSKTTILPLRAKLVPKNISAKQHAPSPEEEELQAKRSAPPQSRAQPVPCPENQKAETWILTYRAAHSNTAVGVPTLRAYHLWHHQRFEMKEVAGFCRDPPLAITTVASYIMQALKEADLPYDGERVKAVLGVLPVSVHVRYRGVLEKGGK